MDRANAIVLVALAIAIAAAMATGDWVAVLIVACLGILVMFLVRANV